MNKEIVRYKRLAGSNSIYNDAEGDLVSYEDYKKLELELKAQSEAMQKVKEEAWFVGAEAALFILKNPNYVQSIVEELRKKEK